MGQVLLVIGFSLAVDNAGMDSPINDPATVDDDRAADAINGNKLATAGSATLAVTAVAGIVMVQVLTRRQATTAARAGLLPLVGHSPIPPPMPAPGGWLPPAPPQDRGGSG